MNALRNVHAALVPGGLVVDSQPVSAHPPIEVDGRALGAADMREWAKTIAMVDELTDRTLAEGLFELVEQRRYVVADAFDDGAELVAVVGTWAGTTISAELADRVAAAPGAARINEEIRLRVLRATSPVESARRAPAGGEA